MTSIISLFLIKTKRLSKDVFKISSNQKDYKPQSYINRLSLILSKNTPRKSDLFSCVYLQEKEILC